jgi:hypothetical protein
LRSADCPASIAEIAAVIISAVKTKRARGFLGLACISGWLLGLSCSLVVGAAEVPTPPKGQWAATTLALLHYNRRLCDGIAGKVRSRWRSLGDGPNSEKAIRDYVLQTVLSELTAARATGDIVDRFLPQAKSEAGRETGSALIRLYELETALCDAVALPTGPRESFDLEIVDLLDRIEREQAELGRLLVVPEATLASALEPYLLPIQTAGVEAEGNYLDYLEGLRPKPQPPTLKELMVAWHHVYATAVAPVKGALGRFVAARQASDAAAIRQACREISATVIPVLRAKELFKAPDSKVDQPLYQAYLELQQLAAHCTAGRFREVDQSLASVQRQLGLAARTLTPYALQP